MRCNGAGSHAELRHKRRLREFPKRTGPVMESPPSPVTDGNSLHLRRSTGFLCDFLYQGPAPMVPLVCCGSAITGCPSMMVPPTCTNPLSQLPVPPIVWIDSLYAKEWFWGSGEYLEVSFKPYTHRLVEKQAMATCYGLDHSCGPRTRLDMLSFDFCGILVLKIS